MKSILLRFIVGKRAAEQRAAVAHSASYGFGRPQIHQAPAGAKENNFGNTHFFRPVRGLNCFGHFVPTVGTVGYYRSLLRSFRKFFCASF